MKDLLERVLSDGCSRELVLKEEKEFTRLVSLEQRLKALSMRVSFYLVASIKAEHDGNLINDLRSFYWKRVALRASEELFSEAKSRGIKLCPYEIVMRQLVLSLAGKDDEAQDCANEIRMMGERVPKHVLALSHLGMSYVCMRTGLRKEADNNFVQTGILRGGLLYEKDLFHASLIKIIRGNYVKRYGNPRRRITRRVRRLAS